MKLNSKLFIAIIIVLSAFVMSCATIIKGSNQEIPINSNPDKASIAIKTLGGVEVFNGMTPAVAKISKKKEYMVTISLAGYKDAVIPLSQEFEAWTLGNILCGGVIGIVIDAVDGAMWKLEPDRIMISLTTASNGNFDTRPYAIFRALDSNGELRSLAIPLVKDYSVSSK